MPFYENLTFDLHWPWLKVKRSFEVNFEISAKSYNTPNHITEKNLFWRLFTAISRCEIAGFWHFPNFWFFYRYLGPCFKRVKILSKMVVEFSRSIFYKLICTEIFKQIIIVFYQQTKIIIYVYNKKGDNLNVNISGTRHTIPIFFDKSNQRLHIYL